MIEYEDEIMNSLDFESPLEMIESDISKLNKYNAKLYNGFIKKKLGYKSVPTAPNAIDVINKASSGDSLLYENYIMQKIEILNREINSNEFVEFQNTIQVKRRKRIKSSFGNELDIHKVYQGKIDTAWDSTIIVKDESIVNFITLCICVGQNWDIPGIDSIWTCAVALKIVDELELAGKNIKIIVFDVGKGVIREKQYTTVSSVVKDYKDRLAPTRLGAMTHLGFLRSFIFCGFAMSKYLCYEHLGHAVHMDGGKRHLLPINIRDDEKQGMSKPIVIGQSLNLHQAVISLRDAYNQLKKV